MCVGGGGGILQVENLAYKAENNRHAYMYKWLRLQTLEHAQQESESLQQFLLSDTDNHKSYVVAKGLVLK